MKFERELLVQMIIEGHSYFENIAPENEGLAVFSMQCIKDDGLRSMINDSYPNKFELEIRKKKSQKKHIPRPK